METRILNDVTFRIRIPQNNLHYPVILLLHGFTGDENSMWIFSQRLPANAMLIAPRGLFPVSSGGYSWSPGNSDTNDWIDVYQPAMDAVVNLLSKENFPEADLTSIFIAGFSQGAALAYALAFYYPKNVKAISGLAGFMPLGAEALARNRPLAGIPVFVAHGTLDEIIPIERARQAVQILKLSGANVSYCEDEVAHKMSADCFKDFVAFFSSHIGNQ